MRRILFVNSTQTEMEENGTRQSVWDGNANKYGNNWEWKWELTDRSERE